MPFRDRREAGRQLAQRLGHLRGQQVVVLALPRGGVPVAAEVAVALHAPLDVIMVRKLGVPVQPELAMGAIGEGGVRVLNTDVLTAAWISDAEIADVEARERVELQRRARRFRGAREPTAVGGRTAVIVDDGMATGSTARAACQVARAQGAAKVVLAVPVAPEQALGPLGEDADEVVCLETPEHFLAIGEWYEDFGQVSDEEVVELLARDAGQRRGAVPGSQPPASPLTPSPATGGPLPAAARPAGPVRPVMEGFDGAVMVTAADAELAGHLSVPATTRGIVLFAHGSGSSRHSPRNQYVARSLNDAGIGTLLFDLLTADEAGDRAHVFDIGLLAGRLAGATDWLRALPLAAGVSLGYFGASTGAAAALWAAAGPQRDVSAVVSRGGRPDLAMSHLAEVRAPVLLIVGGDDRFVLELNREAQRHLRGESELAVIPGATHLFEEPGALERVSFLARDWFMHRLARTHAQA
jgi:putative phosphoribosyl transferase